MFKHFVGDIFILETPPASSQTSLELVFPDSLLADVDESRYKAALRPDQVAKIAAYREEMRNLLGRQNFDQAVAEATFQNSDSNLLRSIAVNIKQAPNEWRGLGYLNSPDPKEWERSLYKIINLIPGGWETQYSKYVAFVQILASNWNASIPDLLNRLEGVDLGINEFFKLERNVSFKLASLVADVNSMAKILLDEPSDISSFAARLSNAFLPRTVYELEEYGLPRMLARKIHDAKLINLEDADMDLHGALGQLARIGLPRALDAIDGVLPFDEYVLNYFFDGIS